MVKDRRLEIRVHASDKEIARKLSFELFGQVNLAKLFIKMLYATKQNRPIILDEQLADFRLAVRQLSGIARNLNQVVRILNSKDNIENRLSSRYVENIRQYVMQVQAELQQLINSNKP